MIRTDLILHFLAGFFLAAVITTFLPLWTGISITVVAGLCKELYDWKVRKTFFDWKDFILTIAGGSLALWLSFVKDNI